MVYHGISLYHMVLHGKPWYTMTLHGKLWYIDHAFSCIVYVKCMIYHDLPVSKHHGIYHGLPVSNYLFQNTIEYDGMFS